MILVVCQPILDKRVKCTKNDIIKNNIGYNNYQNIDPTRSILIENVDINKDCRLNPGGSSLNTTICLSKKKNNEKFVFIGAIGADNRGDYLKNELTSNYGHNTTFYLEEINDAETAECLVLINNKERSLLTNIGAAKKLSLGYLQKYIKYFKEARIIYLCGFFVQAIPKNAYWILEQISKNQKLIFNLSYQSLFENIERKLVDQIFERSTIIIGNRNEFEALHKLFINKEPNSTKEILLDLNSYAQNKKIRKGLICTDAENDTTYIFNNKLGTVKTILIEKEIIDTCGAGDYFAAGIIDGVELIEMNLIEEVINKAHLWAHEFIIDNSGLLDE